MKDKISFCITQLHSIDLTLRARQLVTELSHKTRQIVVVYAMN